MTDVKLVKDFHTTKFDQLYAYLEQHELHANEVHLMRERNQDPLALSHQYGSTHPTQHYSTTYPSIPHAITYPSSPYPHAYSSTIHQDACPQPQSVPQIEYTISTVNQQTNLAEFPQIDSGLACPKPKRKRDAMWFREKVLLVEAQGNGKVLTKEELEFLADPGIAEAKAVLIANLSSYELDVLSEVPISNNTNNDMLNQSLQEMPYSEPSHFVEHSENEIHSDSNID
ncbi:hypothetical protein Tco_0622612, partial [Tanacetum coccineum]